MRLFNTTPRNIIIQGITGSQGSFHAKRMRASGANIVAGTSPNKAGLKVDTIPVFSSIADILQVTRVDCSIIFVPSARAKSAALEAISHKIPLIIIITEGIPLHDMLIILQQSKKQGSRVVGPNCPGILIPNHATLGITPYSLAEPGDIAVVSRSGTLTYETLDGLRHRDHGVRYSIGIGGDPLSGTSFVDCLEMFEQDDSVERIVLIGEIGGTSEIDAAKYINHSVSKPVYAYIAGHSAPQGVTMGHAGAILGNNTLETAQAKTDALSHAGCTVAYSVNELLDAL